MDDTADCCRRDLHCPRSGSGRYQCRRESRHYSMDVESNRRLGDGAHRPAHLCGDCLFHCRQTWFCPWTDCWVCLRANPHRFHRRNAGRFPGGLYGAAVKALRAVAKIDARADAHYGAAGIKHHYQRSVDDDPDRQADCLAAGGLDSSVGVDAGWFTIPVGGHSWRDGHL